MSEPTYPSSSGAAGAAPHREPYGPQTAAVRRFLVQFAGLGADARAEVMSSHRAVVDRREYVAAESLIGETIARAGRTDARDALAGPLLQLVRTTDDSAAADPAHEDALSMLDPIAEPALAALLALLVADLVPATTFAELYRPFESVIAVSSTP